MHQLITVLFSTTNKIQQEGDKIFSELTTRQFMTMVAIVHIPEEERTINNIARMMGTSKQNVKQIIVSLEKKEILYLVEHPTDKRAKKVVVTEQGKNICTRESVVGNKFLEEMAKGLRDEELEQLWTLLNKLFAYNREEFIDYHKNGNDNKRAKVDK